MRISHIYFAHRFDIYLGRISEPDTTKHNKTFSILKFKLFFSYFSATIFYRKTTRPKDWYEWCCYIRLWCIWQSSTVCILDERRIPSAHVSRYYAWTYFCNCSGNLTDPRRSKGGCRVLCLLRIERSGLSNHQSFSTGKLLLIKYLINV